MTAKACWARHCVAAADGSADLRANSPGTRFVITDEVDMQI